MAEEKPPRAFDKAVLDALLKMAEKDKLKPGDFFKGVEMLDKIDRGRGRERLLLGDHLVFDGASRRYVRVADPS